MYECFFLPGCMCTVCVPMEVKRKPWIPWSWSYKRLWAATWLVGTEPGSSEERQMLLAWGPLSSVCLSSVNSHAAARAFPWYSEADPAIFLLGSPHRFTKTKFNAEGTQNHLEICLASSQTNPTLQLHRNTPYQHSPILNTRAFHPLFPCNAAFSVLLILYSFFKIWLLFRAEQQFLFRRGTRFNSIPGSYIAAHNHL